MEFRGDPGTWFKVTRRVPDMGISDTKVFVSRSRAIRQMEEWLQ